MRIRFYPTLILLVFFCGFFLSVDTHAATTAPVGLTAEAAIAKLLSGAVGPVCVPLQSAVAKVAPASTVVAKVVWVKGTFNATSPDANTRALVKGGVVYLHDTLTTDADSQAQIVFTDDTLMVFRASSNFYIHDYAYNPKEKKSSVSSYVMDLVTGGFRTLTGFIAKANPKAYKVNAPVATIGVRGTEYETNVAPDGQLFVGWIKGSPTVSSGNKTITLDQSAPYASVPKTGGAPVPLTERPAGLGPPLKMVPATSGGTSSADASSSGGDSGSSGGTLSVDSSGTGGSAAAAAASSSSGEICLH